MKDPSTALVLAELAPLAEIRDRRRCNFPSPRFVDGRKRADHGARRREAEWRAYHASWQKPIHEIQCDAASFYNLRRNILGLNRKQTARLLRVGVGSVLNWEQGRHPVPFYAYLALLLIAESLPYKMASEKWADWQMVGRFNADSRAPREKRGYVVELVNRATGAHFTADDLEHYNEAMQRVAALEDALGARAFEDALKRDQKETKERDRSGFQSAPAPNRSPRSLKPSTVKRTAR